MLEDIDDQEFMAEMSVLDALMATYTKEAMMLDYVSEEVIQECFYQEGENWDKFKDDLNAGVKGKSGENIIKKILLFIPRAIVAFVKWVGKKLFNKNMEKSIDEAEKAAKDLSPQEQIVVDAACEVIDEMIASGSTEPSKEQVQKVYKKLGDTSYDEEELNKVENTKRIDTELRDGWYKDKGGLFGPAEKTMYMYNVSEEQIEQTLKTVATYCIKLSGRTHIRGSYGKIKSTGYNGKSYWKLRQFSKALNEGKIYSGVNIEAAKEKLALYQKIMKATQKVVDAFDAHNTPKFYKELKAIAKKYPDTDSISVDYEDFEHSGRTVLGIYGIQTKGDLIDISEFRQDLIEIKNIMRSITDSAVNIETRLKTYSGDIGKFVDTQYKDQKAQSRIEGSKMQKIYEAEHRLPLGEIRNSLRTLQQIVSYVCDGSYMILGHIEIAEKECVAYKKMVDDFTNHTVVKKHKNVTTPKLSKPTDTHPNGFINKRPSERIDLDHRTKFDINDRRYTTTDTRK